MNRCHSSTRKYTGKNATHLWHNHVLDVDSELKDEWLDRLNSIAGVQVTLSCSGDPKDKESGKYPCFEFVLTPPFTRKETLLSDALHIAVSISGKSDSIVNVVSSLDPNEIDFEFTVDRGVVMLQDSNGDEIENFSSEDRRLWKLVDELDIKYTPKTNKKDPYYWVRPDIAVTSRIIHKPQFHNAISQWWLDTLEALEDSMSV